MNIGIFTDTYFPQLNGVATSVQTLRRELEKKGHQVYIFTPYDPRQQQETDDHIFRLPSMPFIFVKNYRACFVCPPHILRKIHQLKLDKTGEVLKKSLYVRNGLLLVKGCLLY